MAESNILTNDQDGRVKATDPSILPNDIKTKLLAMRDTLAKLALRDGFDRENAFAAIEETYQILYSIANPNFDKHNPWEGLEQTNPEPELALSYPVRIASSVLHFAAFSGKCDNMRPSDVIYALTPIFGAEVLKEAFSQY